MSQTSTVRIGRRSDKGKRLLASAIAVGALLVACSSTAPSLRRFGHRQGNLPTSQEDVGTVNIGVQSVAAFDEYVSLLQPQFSLTPDQALAKALPVVQTQEFRDAVATTVAVALALAQTSATTTDILNRSTTKAKESAQEQTATEDTRNSTSSTTSGAVSVPAAAERITELLAKVAIPAAAPSTAATLQYQDAASLLQYLAFLNTFIREAAVDRHRIPFIVRFLVSVYPSRSGLPFDIHGDLQFEAGGGEPLYYDVKSADVDTLEAALSKSARSEEGRAFGSRIADLGGEKCEGQTLEVVPLFATDSLESSDLRRTEFQGRDASGSVSGSVGTMGVGVKGGKQAQASGAGAGREIRDLLTLGRPAPDRLSFRIGAAMNEASLYVVPRTYSLATLVLFPARSLVELCPDPSSLICQPTEAALEGGKNEADSATIPRGSEDTSAIRSNLGAIVIPCPQASFFATTRFSNAVTGLDTTTRSVVDLERLLAAKLLDYGVESTPDVMTAVLQSSYSDFERAVLRATVPSASANASSKEEVEKAAAQAAAFVQLSKSDLLRHSAFLDLVDEVTRNGLHAGRFEVPRRTVDGFRTNARSVTVFDDHSRSWFDLGGGQTTAPRIVDATIWATVTPQTGQAQTYGIESTSSKVTPTGRRFEFPSLDALAAIPNSTMALTTTVRTYREFSRWRRPDASYLRQSFTAHRVEMQSKSKEAGYTMRVSVSQAAPDKNGELLIPMELKSAAPMEVVVQTDGGVIALPDPKAAEYTIQGAERIFKTNGIYSLRVAGGVANSWLEVKTFKVDGSERIAGPTARVWILAGAPSTAAKPTP